MSTTHLRTDGRAEVADTENANRDHGCTRDEWCILKNDHPGGCCDDRELWPGPDTEYDA